MAFSYVQWAPRTPLSWDRLRQMSDNDQHILNEINTLRNTEVKDLSEGAKGLVGYTNRTTPYTTNSNAWQSAMTAQFIGEAGRMYKASISIPMMYTSGESTAIGLALNVTGASTLSLGDWYVHVNRNWMSPGGTTFRYFNVSAGASNLILRVRSGRNGTNCHITGNQFPMVLSIEDVGTAI